MKRIPVSIHKLFDYSGHNGSVYTLSEALKTGNFYSAGGDGIVAEWDSMSGKSVKGVLKTNIPIFSILLVPERKMLIVGQNNGGIHFVDLENNKVNKSVLGHTQSIFDLKQISDNEIVACSKDGHISIWDLNELKVNEYIEITDFSLRQIALHPNKTWIALASSDANVYIYDLIAKKTIKSWKAHSQSVFGLEFINDGKDLISIGKDAYIKKWNLESFETYYEVPAHVQAINSLIIVPNKNYFITGSMDKTIKIWRKDTLQLLKVIDKLRNDSHTSSINKLLWLDCTDSLISASDDRLIIQWGLEIQD